MDLMKNLKKQFKNNIYKLAATFIISFFCHLRILTSHVNQKLFQLTKHLKSINNPMIYRNLDKIGKSIEININNEGFDKVLKQLEIFLESPKFKNNPALASGIIYEITESFDILKEKIEPEKFQVYLSCPYKNIVRILDAECKSKNSKIYTEYKNVYWPRIDQEKKFILKLIKQLQDEKYLATKMGKSFQLRSNQPLTEFWIEWLKKEKIDFRDNTQSCVNNLD